MSPTTPPPRGDEARPSRPAEPPREPTPRRRLGRFLAGLAWPRATAGRSRAWVRHKLRGLRRALSRGS